MIRGLLQKASAYHGSIMPLMAKTSEEQEEHLKAIVHIAGPDNMNRPGKVVTIRRRTHDESFLTLVRLEGQWQPKQFKSLIQRHILEARSLK